jgi:hypothetical protein
LLRPAEQRALLLYLETTHPIARADAQDAAPQKASNRPERSACKASQKSPKPPESHEWTVQCSRREDAAARELTDDEWALLAPLIGPMPRRHDGRGRPWRSSREVLDGILWMLLDAADRCAMA